MVAKLLLGDSWPSYCHYIKELRRFKGKDSAELPVRKRNRTQFCVTFQIRVTFTLGDKRRLNLYKSRGSHGQEISCQAQWLSCLFSHVCEFNAWLDFFFFFLWNKRWRKKVHLSGCRGYLGFPHGSVVRNLPGDTTDMGLITESGRSPGVGNGNPLQYSCLENSMNRGARQATVHGVVKNQTRLCD